MRYLMSTAFIASIVVIGCSRGDDAPKEIVVHIKMDSDGHSRGSISATRSLIGMFKTPLDMYELDVGHFPTTADGLSALRTKPSGRDAGKWQGPYLEKDAPLDVWNYELRYQSPGKHNPDSYDIWSVGPDGVDGTDDDIGNW